MERSKSLEKNAKVALFVTCLVNSLRPHIGFCCVSLLAESGYEADIAEGQICCGQPAYNSGDWQSARIIAKKSIKALDIYDYIVIPSGSCAGMMRKHYPLLFENDETMFKKAEKFSEKIYELCEFLAICQIDLTPKNSHQQVEPIKVTYHDSCSCLRELKIKELPRKLLEKLKGVKLIEHQDNENCCGFGGSFCAKYSEISAAMTKEKVNNIKNSGAKLLLSADLGCLINIASYMKKNKITIETRHIAEILAFEMHKPPL